MTRGFSLPELLVAMVLLAIVLGGLQRTLWRVQHSYGAHTARIDVAQTLRAAIGVLAAELRELDAAGGDVVAIGRDSIQIRAPRHLSFLCNRPPLDADPTTLLIARDPAYGLRNLDPEADSILVYSQSDEWIRGSIVGVQDAACPVPDARPARAITARLALDPGPAPRPAGPVSGAPLRGFETVTYRLYRASDGRHYVGQRRAGGLQPLAGPVTQRGLELVYRDATGANTDDPRRVVSVEIRVRVPSARPVWGPDGSRAIRVDSLATHVALRGNPPS
jgi:prepilin-type N-terminal cleavage/methylation domain-containing protein